MAGFSTGGKQHQLSLCAQTVESCGRPVAKIQVPQRVWPSHDALGGEISLVGIVPGEWQLSVKKKLVALTLGFCKGHGLEYSGGFQLLGLLIFTREGDQSATSRRNIHGSDRFNAVVILFQAYVSCHHEDDKMIVFERGSLLWVFNFHSTKSFADYRVGASIAGKYP